LLAGPTKPRNSHPLAFFESAHRGTELFDLPNDLVTQNQREFWMLEFAVEHMQIGSTNGTGSDPDEKLILCRHRSRHFLIDQWTASGLHDHRAHLHTVTRRSRFQNHVFYSLGPV
jgi:hypothetical protein